ncbi:hypothetical protein G3T14_22170 [Methylobacterium sp. BTF04]|uniref:hypothetical protein n=1 Tax=Methylobacterium sp. BTF04 TaxID=2708300 RepID=UPI0013D1AC8E|nr:hypothetical protein [Methylobacterium sp. BTF04]NEU14784.1 hypothetical protein [Methylobacterium sp. BTF04]
MAKTPQPDCGAAFRPFADDATAQTIGGLTIENGTCRIALYGSLDLTRDAAGLRRALVLQAAITAIVAALAAEPLPDALSETKQAVETVKNPFA